MEKDEAYVMIGVKEGEPRIEMVEGTNEEWVAVAIAKIFEESAKRDLDIKKIQQAMVSFLM